MNTQDIKRNVAENGIMDMVEHYDRSLDEELIHFQKEANELKYYSDQNEALESEAQNLATLVSETFEKLKNLRAFVDQLPPPSEDKTAPEKFEDDDEANEKWNKDTSSFIKQSFEHYQKFAPGTGTVYAPCLKRIEDRKRELEVTIKTINDIYESKKYCTRNVEEAKRILEKRQLLAKLEEQVQIQELELSSVF